LAGERGRRASGKVKYDDGKFGEREEIDLRIGWAKGKWDMG
jgi:hypothetical protein